MPFHCPHCGNEYSCPCKHCRKNFPAPEPKKHWKQWIEIHIYKGKPYEVGIEACSQCGASETIDWWADQEYEQAKQVGLIK